MKTKYLTVAVIRQKLLRIKRTHLAIESHDPEKASASLGRLIKKISYPWTRKKVEKIKAEVDFGDPEKAEILIDIFDL